LLTHKVMSLVVRSSKVRFEDAKEFSHEFRIRICFD
jgi:hypothetical protein